MFRTFNEGVWFYVYGYLLFGMLSCHMITMSLPLTVLLYMMSPIPLGLARCCKSRDAFSSESLSILLDISYFLSACIVVSGFGLPLVLARQSVVGFLREVF